MAKYFSLFRLSFIYTLQNYKALAGLSLFLVTCLIIFAHLWTVVSAQVGAVSFTSDQLLWYIAFNEWVLIALPDMQEEMEEDLRSGKLAYLLPRPISYLGSIFAEGMGILSARLAVLGLVTFVFTSLRAEKLPFTGSIFLIALAIGFLAGCLGVIFKMLVGIFAFWVRQVEPFHWIWEKLLFTLGGLMLPLSIYPGWMQKIARLTPFPAILGDRSALALGFTLEKALFILSTILFWSLLGGGLTLFLYRKGLRIVNIEGG